MRALTSDTLGPPYTYAFRQVPAPRPGDGEVRLRVEAVALGYVDALIAAGGYQHKPTPPYVPGAEIVGVVDWVGRDVHDIALGQRVASWQLLAGGGLADHVIAPAATLVALPDQLSSPVAASMLLDHLTAWYALFDRGALKPGETVLVLGAGGGIGSAAVQLAANAGARVIAAAGTAHKRDYATTLGADFAIDYGAADWRDTLRERLGRGVDIVFDPVGGESFEPAFRSLAKGGRHLILGFAGGAIPKLPANLPLLKNGALIGVDARHLFEADNGRARAIWEEIFMHAADGRLPPRLLWPFPFAEAPAAFAALNQREAVGKIVVAS
ncbi:NADPH:quinone oxidoreductase family protein [Sphingomonas sp. MMS24-J45]|uniref:NADPH:quinone oxidoreductase family protein n=1 Tax=Sphingomonas sp. MMS24-J45 TaxID=3238806 RepID=UPI00384E7B82